MKPTDTKHNRTGPLRAEQPLFTSNTEEASTSHGASEQPCSSSQGQSATVAELMLHLTERLQAIEGTLSELKVLISSSALSKEWYSTAEVAHILGRRPYTVREWCRLGRVNANKTHAGRGVEEEWRVSHTELERIQNEGLLPIERVRGCPRL